jgi:CspA family cold shock protein
MTEVGIVKFFNVQKGYGFLERENGGLDIFCHANDIVGYGVTLHEGQRVEFTEVRDEKRNRVHAGQVRPLEPAPVEARYDD